MTLRLASVSAALILAATAAFAGPTVTPNAAATTVITPAPTPAPTQTQSLFIANYVASFSR